MVPVQGIRLRVRQAGQPDGPPLLLLHGWPESSRGWLKAVPFLADRYRLIIPDLRGFGASDMPEGTDQYSMMMVAGDILGILDWAGVEQASIAGHDFGGAVAWSLGTFVPQSIERMVVLASPHPMLMHRVGSSNYEQLSRAFYVWLLNTGAKGERLLSAAGFDLLARFAFGDPPVVGSDDLEAYRAEWTEPGRFHAMAEWYRASYTPDLFNPDRPLRLPSVGVATRYVHGGRDRAFVPSLATGSGEFVEGPYDEVVLEDCSHWMIHEAPERVAGLVAEWLSGA